MLESEATWMHAVISVSELWQAKLQRLSGRML
jgi:hypothetical protein